MTEPMANTREEAKLEQFRLAILKKAQAQRDQILAESQAAKGQALQAEEDRLLEKIFRRMQQEIADLKTAHIKQLSQQAQEQKRRLYAQREEYLSQLVAEAKAQLVQFAAGPDYAPWLLAQVEKLAARCPWEGSTLRVRPQDLGLQEQIQARFGRACTVEGDSALTGGPVLENRAHGVVVDLSFDAALAAQRQRLYQLPQLRLEEQGEVTPDER